MSTSIALQYLEAPEGHLDFILKEVYGKQFASSEQEHLCSRVLNLLRSYHLHRNFIAIKIVQVLVLNHSVLAQHGSAFFTAIIKTIANLNSYQDEGKAVRLVLTTAISCAETLLQETRGKPALTRDIVTPNLPAFIGETVKAISIEQHSTVKVLHQLIQTNTTTFRPFGTKFERKLLVLLESPLDDRLTKLASESLVYCKYALAQKNNQDLFAHFTSNLLLEIKSVLQIYESFIDLENSNLTSFDRIPGTSRAEAEELFAPLNIDSNAPETIFSINERLRKLVALLEAVFATRHSYKVPLGSIVAVVEILLSFNLRFVQLKREFRFIELKNALNDSISQVQELGTVLLTPLQVFEGDLLPHFNGILSSLEYSVPDLDHVVAREHFVLDLLSNATQLIALTYNYTDHSMLTKLVDAAIKLTEERSVQSIDETTQGKKAKHSKKQKGNVGLSDLMSHGQLFVKETPLATKKVLYQFFNALVHRVVLPATKRNQITRIVLLELLRSKNGVPQEIKPLLKSMLMGARADSVNILPFVSKYAGDDEFFSLFINARLPPLPQTVKVTDAPAEEEEQEQEESDAEEFEQDFKRRKVEEEHAEVSVPETSAEPVITEKVEQISIEDKYKDQIFTKSVVTVETEQTAVVETVETKTEITVEDDKRVEDVDDDEGSDFEIPDIALSSDEE